MADRTPIEWTDATWTPVKGCTRVSEGCRNCYAEIMAARFSGPGQWGEGLASIVQTPSGADHRWTGKTRFDEAELVKPLRWKKPRKVFVCSTSDLFHESVPNARIDQVFAVMALAPQHTFQVLTKRPERMLKYIRGMTGENIIKRCLRQTRLLGSLRRSAPLPAPYTMQIVTPLMHEGAEGQLLIDHYQMRSARDHARTWPLPNVWLGVSVEDQATADARIPSLLETPAAIRWASYEPALGPVNWRDIEDGIDSLNRRSGSTLDWIVMGGESGPGARPMHPDWARQTRDQCAKAGVPFLFKQWGAWSSVCQMDELALHALYIPAPDDHPEASRRCRFDSVCLTADGESVSTGNSGGLHICPPGAFCGHLPISMFQVGKKAAGRLLDGVLHDGYPETR